MAEKLVFCPICRTLHDPEYCLVEMFGETFHAFDDWLLSHPDLQDAGTAAQLNVYEERNRQQDEVLRITREVARKV